MSAHMVRPFDDEPADEPAGPEVPHAERDMAAATTIATTIPRRTLGMIDPSFPGAGNPRMICLSSLDMPYTCVRQRAAGAKRFRTPSPCFSCLLDRDTDTGFTAATRR
ncbi:hypothetical protein GCM10010234_49080 [Streptomyces hawaiiensis]